MTQTPTILGQSKPEAEILTTLFTVGLNAQAQFSIFVANQGDNMDEVVVSLLRNSELASDATYIAYNTPLMGHAVMAFAGLFLNSGDSVRIQSKNGTTSFNATGMLYT